MNLLFLCTGNSCRSQMAEGWARQYAGAWLNVQSAGIVSHGKNPLAIEVMKEAGVDISSQQSTRLTSEMLACTDYLVTVCGHADENCPVTPEGVGKEHWPLTDPARARGSKEEVMAIFRKSRDDVRRNVENLVDRLESENR